MHMFKDDEKVEGEGFFLMIYTDDIDFVEEF